MAVDVPLNERVNLGRIGFLNVLPIYYPIESGVVASASRLVTAPPARLNKLMAEGRLDLSPVSSIEAARHADRYVLVPHLSISSRGPVRSVLLMSRRPVHDLSGCSILVSAKSETSIALLELLTHLRWHLREVETHKGCVTASLNQGERPTAFLAIGDEALSWSRYEQYPYRVDLGQAWFEWTGLPFVFGLWTVRRDRLAANPRGIFQTVDELMAAKTWGCGHLPIICREAERVSGFDHELLSDYYRHLRFDLGADEQCGLQHFFRLLYQTNRLPSIPALEPLSRFALVA